MKIRNFGHLYFVSVASSSASLNWYIDLADHIFILICHIDSGTWANRLAWGAHQSPWLRNIPLGHIGRIRGTRQYARSNCEMCSWTCKDENVEGATRAYLGVNLCQFLKKWSSCSRG